MSNKLTKSEEKVVMEIAERKENKHILEMFGPEKVAELHTAMMQSGHEMMLAIEDILTRQFHFDEGDFKLFHQQLNEMLTGLREYEIQGYNMISPNAVKSVGDLALLRLAKNSDKTPKHITANIDGGLEIADKKGKELEEGLSVKPESIKPKSESETQRSLSKRGGLVLPDRSSGVSR